MSQRMTGKRRRAVRVLPLGAVAVAVLLATACSSSGSSGNSGTSSSTGSATGASSKTISVGVIVDRTGGDPLVGEFEGIDSYFKYMNANGGINGYQVNVIGFD